MSFADEVAGDPPVRQVDEYLFVFSAVLDPWDFVGCSELAPADAVVAVEHQGGVGGASAVGGLGPAYPSSATSDAFCVCADALGAPEFGFTLGAWFPTNLFEIVRLPYCSPTLAGTFLNSNIRLLGGNKKKADGGPDKGFYQYHYFA